MTLESTQDSDKWLRLCKIYFSSVILKIVGVTMQLNIVREWNLFIK